LKKDNELIQDCLKDVFYSWLDEDAFFEIDNMCLCHGLYGNIEIAQYLLRSIRNKNVQEKVNRIYFEKFSELEWIKGFDYEFEHFMLGNMGIAYVMLELLYHDIPSVLTLELHK
jgi:lantibiotic modifying enzyme